MIAKTSNRIPIKLELVNQVEKKSDEIIASITMPCGMSDLQYTYPMRVTVNKTAGGGWVNDFGTDFPTISFTTEIYHNVVYRFKNPIDEMSSPFDFNTAFKSAMAEKINGKKILMLFKEIVAKVKNYKLTAQLWGKLQAQDIFSQKFGFAEPSMQRWIYYDPIPADLKNNGVGIVKDPDNEGSGWRPGQFSLSPTIFNDKKGFSNLYFKFYDFWNDEYWYVTVQEIIIRQSKSSPTMSIITCKMMGLREFAKPPVNKPFSLFDKLGFLKDAISFVNGINDTVSAITTSMDRLGKDLRSVVSGFLYLPIGAANVLTSCTKALTALNNITLFVKDMIAFPYHLMEAWTKALSNIYLAGVQYIEGWNSTKAVWNKFKNINAMIKAYERQNARVRVRYSATKMANMTGDIETTPTSPGPASDTSRTPLVPTNYKNASITLPSVNLTNSLYITVNEVGTPGNNYKIKVHDDYNSGINIEVYKSDVLIASKLITNNEAILKYNGNGNYQFSLTSSSIMCVIRNSTDRSTSMTWGINDKEDLLDLDSVINGNILMFNLQYVGNAITASANISNSGIKTTLSGDQLDGSKDLDMPFVGIIRMKNLSNLISQQKALQIRYIGNASKAYFTKQNDNINLVLSGDQSDGSDSISFNLQSNDYCTNLVKRFNPRVITLQYKGNASWSKLYITSNVLQITLAGDQTDGSTNLYATLSSYPTIGNVVDYINSKAGYTASGTDLDKPSAMLQSVSAVDCKSKTVDITRTTYVDFKIINDVNANLLLDINNLDISYFTYKTLYADTLYRVSIGTNTDNWKADEIATTVGDCKQPLKVYMANFYTMVVSGKPILLSRLDRNYSADSDKPLSLTSYNNYIKDYLDQLLDDKSKALFITKILTNDRIKVTSTGDEYQFTGGI